ncbi:hypothetical protein [Streptomyces sp. NPDC058045]|uniref:hypothetical protein n=1 Tax=Streptomyces sp. NPDC058045 TaxID=3346311 RepID=UPI0036EE3475
MAEFTQAALGFPAALFTAALVVVVAFWLLVLFGVAEHDSFDSDVDVHATEALGMGGVPVTVWVSLSTALAWFASLTGSVLLDRSGTGPLTHFLLDLAVLAGSLIAAWAVTRLLVRPLRHLFPDEPGPSRADFVGSSCVIRTGRVDAAFGQAEVTASDGSSALVQVRQTGGEPLGMGSTGLLYEYDAEGEFFWVAAPPPGLDELPEAASGGLPDPGAGPDGPSTNAA